MGKAIHGFTIVFCCLDASMQLASAHLSMVVAPPVDHPVTLRPGARTTHLWRSGAGAWGESFVDSSLRLRGFGEVYEIKKPGGQGIDRLALKRNALGKLVDVRFVEVKTHRGRTPTLSMTKAGRQLSRGWLAEKFKMMRGSPDPQLRRLAVEVAQFRKSTGVPIERLGELHDINTRTGRYVRRSPVTGRELSSESIESLLGRLQRRGAAQSTRQWAAHSLAVWDQIRAASQQRWLGEGKLAEAQLVARMEAAQLAHATGVAAKSSFRRMPRIARGMGGAVAVAFEARQLYGDISAYSRGDINRRQLIASTSRSGGGIAGASAGAATGAWLGGFGGPAAWLTVPAGGLVGGVVGYTAGSVVAGMAADEWYKQVDESVRSEVDSWLATTPYSALYSDSQSQ